MSRLSSLATVIWLGLAFAALLAPVAALAAGSGAGAGGSGHQRAINSGLPPGEPGPPGAPNNKRPAPPQAVPAEKPAPAAADSR